MEKYETGKDSTGTAGNWILKALHPRNQLLRSCGKLCGRYLRYVVLLGRETFRKYVADGGTQKSASLAYQTIFSIVPIFTVAFIIVNAFGGFSGSESPLVVFLSRHLIPVSPEDIAGYIAKFSSRISVGAIGWVGVGVLVTVSLFLLDTVESALNSIWRVERRRPLVTRFITYYAVLTLGPLLLVISLYESARLHVLLPKGVETAIPQYLLAVAVTWIALLLSYKLFPNTAVRLKSVVLGAMVGAILFELAKVGFNLYVNAFLFKPYARIYGAIALFPLFLVWIFVAWNVVLFGAEFAYVHQHLPQIEWEGGLLRASGLRPAERFLLANERMALRALVTVGRNFALGSGPISSAEVSRRIGGNEDIVESVLERLARLGFLVAEQERELPTYLPARPLSKMETRDVLERYRAVGTETAPPEQIPETEDFLAKIERSVQDVATGVSVERLTGVTMNQDETTSS